MDTSQFTEDHIDQMYEESNKLVEKWFDCLPEEWGDIGYPSALLGALHFSATIAQADKNMSKKTFTKLFKEAWEFVKKRNEIVEDCRAVETAKERLH